MVADANPSRLFNGSVRASLDYGKSAEFLADEVLGGFRHDNAHILRGCGRVNGKRPREPTMQRVAIYARVSTDDKAKTRKISSGNYVHGARVPAMRSRLSTSTTKAAARASTIVSGSMNSSRTPAGESWT